MTPDLPPPPVVEITENKDRTWNVTVSWRSGRIEELGHFLTPNRSPEMGAKTIYSLGWIVGDRSKRQCTRRRSRPPVSVGSSKRRSVRGGFRFFTSMALFRRSEQLSYHEQ